MDININADMDYSDDEKENIWTLVQDDTFCLIIEEYDGKGVFKMEPNVIGLQRIIHKIPRRKLNHITLRTILSYYVDVSKYENCTDEMNLVTEDNFQKLYLDEPIGSLFFGKRYKNKLVTIYLQNTEYLIEDYMDEQQEQGGGKFDTIIITTATLLIILAVIGLIALLQSIMEKESEN